MQRLGSTKKCRYSGLGMALLLRLERGSIRRRTGGFSDPAAAHFVLRDPADRILRRHGETVRALFAWPVVRDEDRVRPDRGHHHRAERHRAASRFSRRPVVVADAELPGEPRVDLEAWLR